MSPAATMPRDQAGLAILAAADRLFYERGIAAVAVTDVRDAAGVSLRRLYASYPSKRELVAGWLQDRHVHWMAWFTAAVKRHSATGTDPLLATFDALIDWRADPGFRGCAFINAIAETAEVTGEHRAIVIEHKRSLIDHLVAMASTSHPGAPQWLPPAMSVLIDGAIVESAIFRSDDPILAARHAAERLLASAG